MSQAVHEQPNALPTKAPPRRPTELRSHRALPFLCTSIIIIRIGGAEVRHG
jgi:hypothetical protein